MKTLGNILWHFPCFGFLTAWRFTSPECVESIRRSNCLAAGELRISRK